MFFLKKKKFWLKLRKKLVVCAGEASFGEAPSKRKQAGRKKNEANSVENADKVCIIKPIMREFCDAKQKCGKHCLKGSKEVD